MFIILCGYEKKRFAWCKPLAEFQDKGFKKQSNTVVVLL